jgi:two-component system sensor histidine kinase/response regulator
MCQKKILIIDDENLVLVTTAMLLNQANMKVITAKSGMEGMALAEKEKPDIVLLDIQMPEMDGWNVLARLKADDRLAGIPVVLFSGDDSAESVRLAKERGASAVSRKPFELPDLLATISGLLEKNIHEQ